MLPVTSPSNLTLAPQKSTPQTEKKVEPLLVIQADSPWVSESSSSDAASQPTKATPGCPKTLPVKTNGVGGGVYALLCAAKQARTSEGVVEGVPVIGTAVATHPVLVPNATPMASMQLMEAGGHGPSDYFMLPASVDISTGARSRLSASVSHFSESLLSRIAQPALHGFLPLAYMITICIPSPPRCLPR